MLKLLSTAAVIGLVTLAATPSFAAGASCQAAMTDLMGEWQAVGYPMPQKPDQARVIGNNGHAATGQQVTYMRAQIAQAAQECASGENDAALTRIASVSAMLDGHAAGGAAH